MYSSLIDDHVTLTFFLKKIILYIRKSLFNIPSIAQLCGETKVNT